MIKDIDEQPDEEMDRVRLAAKRHKGTLGGEVHTWWFGWGICFTRLFICQNFTFINGFLGASLVVQADSRKGRGTKDQIANICWIMEKAREF